jgi:hypothetical protein
MKRVAAVLVLVALVAAAVHVYAQPGPKRSTVIRGEVLDMGCFVSRSLRGALHKECGSRCVQAGIPMGIITADSVVYWLTQNHDRAMTPQQFQPPDPYNQLRGWISSQAEVTGFLWEQKGMRMMEVKMAKLLPPPAAPPAK